MKTDNKEKSIKFLARKNEFNALWREKDEGNNRKRRKGDRLKVDEEYKVMLFSHVSNRFRATQE